jgi:hypothetical protein
MRVNKLALIYALLASFSIGPIGALKFDTGQWIAPFNNETRLRTLCVDNNEFWIMRGRDNPVVSPLLGNFE